MSLDFRIEELTQAQRPDPVPMRDRSGFAPPGGGGGTPLAGLDPYAGAGAGTFCWDVAGQGWDQGSWYGEPESLSLRLTGSLDVRRGDGAASFSRPYTTTYTDETGATQTAAVNVPAWDWLPGPAGANLWALRCDDVNTLLTLPAGRLLRRQRGGLSLWIRPQWAGTATGTDRICLQCGSWRLWKPAGGTILRWEVPLLDGTTAAATFDLSAWTANSWHLLGASWDRTAGQIRLWTDSGLRATTTTAQRYGELGDTLGVGQGTTAGLPAGAYLLDFRAWPLPLTTTLLQTLWAVR